MPPFVPPIQQTRQSFLGDLAKHIKTAYLDQKDQECLICLVPYFGYDGPMIKFSERAIILYDECIIGEDCARHWLTRPTNDCPYPGSRLCTQAGARLGVPDCCANAEFGLKLFRHDLVAAVAWLVREEGLVGQKGLEIIGVEGSWMEGVEVLDVPGVAW
ncbi:hypothetical protein AC579_4323 [Pseudocercospora musae]|uniref:Uncharacterized protein n=1 Tax=Pseudocercospora musae TaxID=113226 RepID=A0A139IQL0_9PEZI|nr:hypothetical protein AC579_4323 [Pseudocercospora musae]